MGTIGKLEEEIINSHMDTGSVLEGLRSEVKYLTDKWRDIERIVTKLQACLGDLDNEITDLVEKMKTLRIKVERYDDIDIVVEKMEAKVGHMKHKAAVLDRIKNETWF